VHADSVDLHAVAAAEVLDHAALVVDADSRVLARYERVLDREIAIEAASDHRDASRQIELLKEKPEPIARHELLSE
jgi:hypothetical protein